MQDLRVAIVGYGLSGSVFHAPLISSTSGLALRSVVTGDARRQAQARADHPRAEVLSRAQDLWRRASDHDVVVIAAPNEVHTVLARDALDAGLAVVVDKPLATSATSARALVDHAETHGALLTVFHNRRWDSDQLTLRRLLSDGTLGDVLRYESRLERWRPELKPGGAWRETTPSQEGGGVLLDLGTHLVDQALVLFGRVTHVYGEIATRRGGASDDEAFVSLRHSSGTISHLSASLVAAASGPRLRVLGTRAGYVVADVDGQEDALRSGARPGDGAAWGTEPEERWGRVVRGEEGERVRSEPGAWPDFYAALVQALVQDGPPPVDPGDAVAVLEVLEAARRSADTHAVIRLRSPARVPSRGPTRS
jgi:predicted dehydrogenase